MRQKNGQCRTRIEPEVQSQVSGHDSPPVHDEYPLVVLSGVEINEDVGNQEPKRHNVEEVVRNREFREDNLKRKLKGNQKE